MEKKDVKRGRGICVEVVERREWRRDRIEMLEWHPVAAGVGAGAAVQAPELLDVAVEGTTRRDAKAAPAVGAAAERQFSVAERGCDPAGVGIVPFLDETGFLFPGYFTFTPVINASSGRTKAVKCPQKWQGQPINKHGLQNSSHAGPGRCYGSTDSGYLQDSGARALPCYSQDADESREMFSKGNIL